MTSTQAPDVSIQRSNDFGDYSPAYVRRRKFSKERRSELAKTGHALPWGGFPIENCGDVGNAIRAIGRAKDRAQTIAHIKKWHSKLGCKNPIPASWKSMAFAEFSAMGPLRRIVPVLRTKNLYITRVVKDRQTGERRWFAKASGTEVDLYNERMSLTLFDDFIRRAEAREPVPEPFSSKAWNGGLPYLGVAHYLDMGGKGIVGQTVQMWVDGSLFKAKGTFADSKIAKAAYEAIERDIKGNVPLEQRVRISIAFLDWEHDHKGAGTFKRKSLSDRCKLCADGVGGKVYKAGHLVHLALTRIPAYPSATIQLEERAMGKKSNRELDAESIVGESHASELEEEDRKLVGRSTDVAPGAVVVRQDEEEDMEEEMDDEEEEMDEEEEEGRPYGGAKSLAAAEQFLTKSAEGKPVLMDSMNVLSGVLSNIAGPEHVGAIEDVLADWQTRLDAQVVKALVSLQPIISKEATMAEETPVQEPQAEVAGAEAAAAAAGATAQAEAEQASTHVLDEALLGLRAAFDEAKATPVDVKARLSMVQGAVDTLGVAVAKNISDQPAPEALGGMSPEQFTAAVQAAVAPIVAPLVAALGSAGNVTPSGAAIRRAIQPGSLLEAKSLAGQSPDPVIPEAEWKNPKSEANVTPGIRNLVRRTVGLGG